MMYNSVLINIKMHCFTMFHLELDLMHALIALIYIRNQIWMQAVIKSCLPCNCIHLKSQCRWLHSDKDWECIHPPAPRSNFQYNQPGRGSDGHFLHPDTDPSYDTDGRHQLLHRQDETSLVRCILFSLTGLMQCHCLTL